MRPRTVDVGKLKEMHERGLSQTAIARAFGIHRTSVGYYLYIMGISRTTVRNYAAWQERARRARMFEASERRRKQEADEVARLYVEEDLRKAEIGRRMHMDRRKVHRILSRRGLQYQSPVRKPSPPKIKVEPKPQTVYQPEPIEVVEKLLILASPRKSRAIA